MRIVGLDLGSKTIGVAVSDEEGIIALPLRTLSRRGGKADLNEVAKVLAETGSEMVVLGLPVQLDGKEGLAARRVRAFGTALAADGDRCTVEYWDERFSTTAAQRMLIEADLSRKKRKQVVDHVAASLILQGYLDAQRDDSQGPSDSEAEQP